MNLVGKDVSIANITKELKKKEGRYAKIVWQNPKKEQTYVFLRKNGDNIVCEKERGKPRSLFIEEIKEIHWVS